MNISGGLIEILESKKSMKAKYSCNRMVYISVTFLDFDFSITYILCLFWHLDICYLDIVPCFLIENEKLFSQKAFQRQFFFYFVNTMHPSKCFVEYIIGKTYCNKSSTKSSSMKLKLSCFQKCRIYFSIYKTRFTIVSINSNYMN